MVIIPFCVGSCFGVCWQLLPVCKWFIPIARSILKARCRSEQEVLREPPHVEIFMYTYTHIVHVYAIRLYLSLSLSLSLSFSLSITYKCIGAYMHINTCIDYRYTTRPSAPPQARSHAVDVASGPPQTHRESQVVGYIISPSLKPFI